MASVPPTPHLRRTHLPAFPSTSTFTSIISACGRAGDTAQAFALYDEMERRGVPANSATFTTLIAACGATGDAARAFAAMKRMEALKLPPNLSTYNSLISCCARAVLVAARTAEEQAPAPGDGPAERLEAAIGADSYTQLTLPTIYSV